MGGTQRRWAIRLARLATRARGRTLGVVAVLTVIALGLSFGLELSMNWTDLLPSDHPDVRRYEDMLDRFGEPNLVVALEGDRDAIVAMAEELTPQLQALPNLRNVVARLPSEFFLDHGFALIKPERFERTLDAFRDPTLVGTLRGLNDDYEAEYTSSESNLRRDEVEVARGLLGMTRTLELLHAGIEGDAGADAMAEATDALLVGEPWQLSLDRRMLLITLWPTALWGELDLALATVDTVEAIMQEVSVRHPDVHASTTGLAKIGQDEMNSVGFYTVLLSFAALILMYLLLARAFRSWGLPLLALVPLVLGIIWTQGLLYLLFGGLNIITAMMMLVLLGLGVDFSIHLITRFQEESTHAPDVEAALAVTLDGSGAAVVIGALTTAAAFLTLTVGETRGIHEFGAAAGFGILLTLVAIFLTLPSLLVLRQRRIARRAGVAPVAEAPPANLAHGYRWIGALAGAGWRHARTFLAVAVLAVAGCVWAMRHTQWEYDFLELEAKGLRSVELQRQIPERFGVSDHGAWVVTASVDESRALTDEYRDLPEVGEVYAISDYLPPAERLAHYRPALDAFRAEIAARPSRHWRPSDAEALATEITRLWDNLDLVSNLAYMAGLDRIVRVIDGITGVDTETGATATTAVLPRLERTLQAGVDGTRLGTLAAAWEDRMRGRLARMAGSESVTVDDVPGSMRRMFVPIAGDGFLLHIVPRRYLWNRESLERFAAETEAVSPGVIGTEKLIIIMNEETLADGKEASLLALAVIAVLLLLHFRGPVGLLALLPLAVGSLAMLGLMFVLGMKYNYINLIAAPIVLGIGIDDGVHALHRFREETGTGLERVTRSFRFVGKAILLTSLTTMIGFGSVAFYEMRGMASFGQVLFMGVGFCFVATVLVLPAVLRVATRGE